MNTWVKGQYNFRCQKCYKKAKSSELRLDGYIKGLVVCKDCWDRFPPLELPPKPRLDPKPIKHVAPPARDVFIYAYRTWDTIVSTWNETYDTWDTI